jgi:hypothetical protein
VRSLSKLSPHAVYRTLIVVDKPSDDGKSFALVRRCLRIILTRDSGETIPSTYEGIYAACRYIVTVLNMGEGLYGTLKMELEQSVGRLASDLTSTSEMGMNWIVEFVRVCQWFELRVVRPQKSLESSDVTDWCSTVFTSITLDVSRSNIRSERA